MENSLFMLFCTLFFHMNNLHNAMNVKRNSRRGVSGKKEFFQFLRWKIDSRYGDDLIDLIDLIFMYLNFYQNCFKLK